MEVSTSFSLIDDYSKDDTFFYAFVGLTVWMGVIGLIWPTAILWERIRANDQSSHSEKMSNRTGSLATLSFR
jgi:hypothetical protein